MKKIVFIITIIFSGAIGAMGIAKYPFFDEEVKRLHEKHKNQPLKDLLFPVRHTPLSDKQIERLHWICKNYGLPRDMIQRGLIRDDAKVSQYDYRSDTIVFSPKFFKDTPFWVCGHSYAEMLACREMCMAPPADSKKVFFIAADVKASRAIGCVPCLERVCYYLKGNVLKEDLLEEYKVMATDDAKLKLMIGMLDTQARKKGTRALCVGCAKNVDKKTAMELD